MKFVMGVIGVMVVIILLMKNLYSQSIFFNSGLLVVLLCTLYFNKHYITYLFAVLSIGMILYYTLHIPPSERHDQFFIQQMLAILAICVTTILIVSLKKLYRSSDKERIQLNALLQFTPLGTIITKCTGEIVLINPAACRLIGHPEGQVMGRSVDMLLPARFHAQMDEYRKKAENSAPAELKTLNLDVFALKPEGLEFPVHIHLNAYYQDKECYVVAFIDDVTERKEAEKVLIEQKEQLEKVTHDVRRMNTELENKVAERTLILREALLELEKSQTELSDALSKEKELNEIKSRFVSMASHEFRTPLSAVLSSASLIGKYPSTEDQDKRDKHIRRIKGSVKHLNDLLEDFLSLGKLEEGRVFANAESFDVKEFMLDIFDEMRHTLKNGQQMDLSYKGEVIFITDKRLLKNIMINLLSNAIKFSDDNKRILVSVENLSSRLIIRVKDEGIGISKEDMPYLFSTFYRAKNAINIQGTGLGLHIIKRYIETLEGEITLTSELGEGSTFTIDVPSLYEILA